MLGRDPHVVALEQYLNAEKFYDPILDGLLSAVRYDKTYFDKIVASLLPLLEKLTTGTLATLLAPDYHDLDDSRPILDWQQGDPPEGGGLCRVGRALRFGGRCRRRQFDVCRSGERRRASV